MLNDWEHWSITALDGVPSVCLTNYLFVRNATVCSIHSFKKQLDSYLSTVTDSPCQPGFWELDVGKQTKVTTP